MLSSQPLTSQLTSQPYDNNTDDLSNLSVVSSSQGLHSQDFHSQAGGDSTYEEPITAVNPAQLDLLRYMIPSKDDLDLGETCESCDQVRMSELTTQRKGRRGEIDAYNRQLSGGDAKSMSLDKLSKGTAAESSSCCASIKSDLNSPHNQSTPNLQFEPGYPAPHLPHATSSPLVDNPTENNTPLYHPLLHSQNSCGDRSGSSRDIPTHQQLRTCHSAAPQLEATSSSTMTSAAAPLSVNIVDRGNHSHTQTQSASQSADSQFSPFKFSPIQPSV